MPRPIHFEFQVEDPDRARQFYQSLFDWKFQSWPGPTEYWVIFTGQKGDPGIDGGMMRRKPGAEDFTATYNTVGVPDLDLFLKKALDSGGTQVVPKMAIPGFGWLAYCKDTEGNIFGMMQSDPTAK